VEGVLGQRGELQDPDRRARLTAVVEDGHPGFGLSREAAAPIQQLALERGEEALAEGVVVGVAHARPIDGRTPASRQQRPKVRSAWVNNPLLRHT
jgi:hypothetical protein